MTPVQLRVIFASFALALLGLTANAFIFQPTRSTDIAAVAPRPMAPGPRAAEGPAKPLPQKQAITDPVAPARPTVDAAPPPAPKSKTQSAESPNAITLARLAIDSTSPDRPGVRAEAGADLVRRVQKELLGRGYGPIITRDRLGPMLRAAIMAWEYDNHLPLTGEPTEGLLDRMTTAEPPRRAPDPMARKIKTPEAEQVTRTVQHSLTALGHAPGAIDGQLSPETERAIRAFETSENIPPTGRVSAELFGRLARAMGARSSAGR